MTPKLKNILYASDLSEKSAPALEWTMMLAKQHDAKVVFLHVLEEFSLHATNAVKSFMGEEKWKEMIEAHYRDADSSIKANIQRFCDQVTDDLPSCPEVSDIVIRRGVPVELILQEAEERHCDAIIMGTHGAGVFEDAMIGSTARRVLRRSTLPVFIIPYTQHK